MNILMFNMSEYSEWVKRDIPNRNRHVLFNLLKDKRVDKIFAVDFMPYTGKRALRVMKDDIMGSFGGKVIKRTAFSKLTKVNSKLYVYSGIRTVVGHEEGCYQEIRKMMKSVGMNEFILWSYFPMFRGYWHAFKDAEVKVFDTVDNWMEHSNFGNYQERLKMNYKLIEEKADLVFTVSKSLLDLFPKHINKHWVSNGVDSGHFKPNSKGEITKQIRKLKSIKKPIIGYVGIIQDRLDFKLLEYLSRKNKDKSFVFVGPIWQKSLIAKIKKKKNVYFTGKVSYKELPKMLKEFDVGIVPHKINAFTDSMNPLKMYEYLAMGLPVVTTPVSGTDQFEGHVKQSKSKEDFSHLVQLALDEKENVGGSKERRALAKKFSWKNKVSEMLDLIEKVRL